MLSGYVLLHFEKDGGVRQVTVSTMLKLPLPSGKTTGSNSSGYAAAPSEEIRDVAAAPFLPGAVMTDIRRRA